MGVLGLAVHLTGRRAVAADNTGAHTRPEVGRIA